MNEIWMTNDWISCGKDKTLYCCDADNHKFYGIKQNGTILFSFSFGDFKVPICVAAATNGNTSYLFQL
jgi:hypothetical protein